MKKMVVALFGKSGITFDQTKKSDQFLGQKNSTSILKMVSYAYVGYSYGLQGQKKIKLVVALFDNLG